MADSWQETTSRQVKLIGDRLNELLSSGVDLLQSSLGVDLGLQPELVPPWVILLAACLGLVLMVALWASACRGLFRKKPATITALGDSSESKRAVAKPSRNEEPKKKKRKTEKKVQPNGRLVAEPPEEEVQLVEDVVPHHPPAVQAKTDRAVEVKKAKKKSKQAAKEVKVAAADGKEPEGAGTWETKVSNKEKREQRRKDKTPGDGSGSPGGARGGGSGSPGGARGGGSGSPGGAKGGGLESPKGARGHGLESPRGARGGGSESPRGARGGGSESPRGARGDGSGSPIGARGEDPSPLLEPARAAVSIPATQEEKKEEPAKVSAVEADVAPAVDSSEAVELPAGWTDLSVKVSPDVIGPCPDNWAANPSAAPVTPEITSVWGQETEGSWTVIDATGLSFTELGVETPAVEPLSAPGLSLTPDPVQPPVEDEWSGPNVQSAEPGSDWNAPSEAWVNEEVTPPAETPPPQEEQPPVPAKVSDEEEKQKTDSPPDGNSKSKRKKKKKKKQVEDGGVAAQDAEEPETEVEVGAAVKKQSVQEAAIATVPPAAQEVVQTPPSVTPVPPNPAETEHGNLPAPTTEEKPSKTVKKKKARRET